MRAILVLTVTLLLLLVVPTSGKVLGFTIDVEPNFGPEAVAFVNELAAWRSGLAGTGLTLSADAGTSWSGTPDWITEVNGTSKLLSEWLIDLTDEAIIMDYDRVPASLLSRAEPYLTYADGQPNKSVTVGLALNVPGGTATWWQTANLTELEALVAVTLPSLAQHRSFSGRIALFHAGTLWNSSTANVTIANEPKTIWYMVDDWVYNTTAREEFFALAARQHIVQIYDAPHAGARPHIGAAPADEAMYRDFVRAADTLGIDMQFFSGLDNIPGDIAFINSCGNSHKAPTRPNFLVILVDDLDVELGSASSEAMPALHELLVSQGLNFSAAHVTSPICCPSRTSLFSGRYPHNLGDDTLGWCGNFSAQREDNFLTALGHSGYAVQQVGKWYNEEEIFCKHGYTPAWKKGAQGDASDAFLLCDEGVYFNNTFNDNGVLVSAGADGYMTSVLGNRSLNWLINASLSAASVPFISYVGFHAPHLPATPAPWYANADVPTQAPRTPAWNTGWQDKHGVIDNGIDKPMSADLINGSDVLHAQRLRTLLSVEDFLKDAVAALHKAGTLENTYIIFTSDHGYHIGTWGLWSEKAMPYDHDTHIPFIIRGPNIVPASISSDLVAMNIDLGPTLLELAGIANQWPSGTGVRDGKSLVQLLNATTPTTTWRQSMLIEFVGWVTPYEWLRPCQFGLAPWTNCTADSPAGLINGQSNRWTALRIINASENTLVADYRAPSTPLQRDSTNFTEIYNVAEDAEFIVNLAVKGRMSPAQISLLRDKLWDVASCMGEQCP